MPAFVTHSLFGETVLDKLARKDIKNQILLYPSAFEWGLQGPDPLFFSIKDREKLVHAAETMHKSGTKELFFSIKHLITASENKKKEIGLSYFLGFLCHYYLDMNAHPFVYYFENKQQKEMLPSLRPFIHHRIESDIDSALCQRF